MTARVVVLDVTVLEAAHLSGMVRQFVDLLDATTADGVEADPAVARLVPDAYRDDPEASAEFRRLTGGDLLARRRTDAEVLLATLSPAGSGMPGVPLDPTTLDPQTLDEETAHAPMVVTLDLDETAAWMRSLTALRLVLASRLGIETEADHDVDDPRFGVYEWLGYRLEGLIDAADRVG